MPLDLGGQIVSLPDIERRLATGADKDDHYHGVDDPGFIRTAAENFAARPSSPASVLVLILDGLTGSVCRLGHRAMTGHPALLIGRGSRIRGGELCSTPIDRDGQGQGVRLDFDPPDH